jgi:hypothetical protein
MEVPMEQTIENGKRKLQRDIQAGQSGIRQGVDMAKKLLDTDIVSQAQGWYKTANGAVSDVAKRGSTVTRRYPLRSLFGAVAVGYLFARIFRRKMI